MNNDLPGAIATKTGYNRHGIISRRVWADCFMGWMWGSFSGALPYLEATFKDAATEARHFTAGQLSLIVAAVLLGSVISTLFAGLFADWLGRRTMMIVSGLLFVLIIPVISLAHSYDALMAGRLLQGIHGGFIGVVIPLYLAECLGASDRGKGTGIFQWLLTLGIVAAAIIGYSTAIRWTRWPGSRTRRNCIRPGTRPGAASFGCHCHREFCLSSAAFLWRNRRASSVSAGKN